MLTRGELRVGETYVSIQGDDKDNKRTILAIGDSKVFYKCPQTGYEYIVDIKNALHHWSKLPVRHKGWMNIYETFDDSLSGMVIYPTKEKADKKKFGKRVACIEIEFEEGQGL